MSDTIRVWTRREIEDRVANDPNERSGLRLLISPAVLKALMDMFEVQGQRVEILSAYGDPDRCEMRFFKRDEV